MAVPLPLSTIILIIYMWISMIAYSFLIFVILSRRRRVSALRSSYYWLFLLEAMGNFFVFFQYEIILRPRKYNFFDAYHERLTWFAIYSITALFVARGVWFLAEIFIAVNRFTVICHTLHYERLWRTPIIVSIYIFVWTISITAALPFALDTANTKFVFAPNGILQMYGGTVAAYQEHTAAQDLAKETEDARMNRTVENLSPAARAADRVIRGIYSNQTLTKKQINTEVSKKMKKLPRKVYNELTLASQ
ncbi:hypothetical protein Aduo_010789 [Ancylostoma duodenale]